MKNGSDNVEEWHKQQDFEERDEMKHFDAIWKEAETLMINKLGKNPKFPQTRAISFLPVITKVVERVYLARRNNKTKIATFN